MAKVLGPLYSIGVSGRIGDGYVMSNWRGIPYARRFVMPTNRFTKRQAEIKGIFARQSQRWAELEEGERQAWREFCKSKGILGPANTAFTSYAVLAADAGLAEVSLPPESSKPFPPEIRLKRVGRSLVVSWEAAHGVPQALSRKFLMDLWLWSGRVSWSPHRHLFRHFVYVPFKDRKFVLKEVRSRRKYAFRTRIILPDAGHSDFASASLIVE
jgi:hypothetical protein